MMLWLKAAPARIAIATNTASAISSSLAPCSTAALVWTSIHHGHWVTWAGPRRFAAFGRDGAGPWRGFQAWRPQS